MITSNKEDLIETSYLYKNKTIFIMNMLNLFEDYLNKLCYIIVIDILKILFIYMILHLSTILIVVFLTRMGL